MKNVSKHSLRKLNTFNTRITCSQIYVRCFRRNIEMYLIEIYHWLNWIDFRAVLISLLVITAVFPQIPRFRYRGFQPSTLLCSSVTVVRLVSNGKRPAHSAVGLVVAGTGSTQSVIPGSPPACHRQPCVLHCSESSVCSASVFSVVRWCVASAHSALLLQCCRCRSLVVLIGVLRLLVHRLHISRSLGQCFLLF